MARPEFHIYDRDEEPPKKSKYQAEADAVNLGERCKAVVTAKREMENYIHHEAINEAYAKLGFPLGFTTVFAEFDDVPCMVAERVFTASANSHGWQSLSEEKRKGKVSKAKHLLNSMAVPLMTKNRLSQVDVNSDVLGWFADMKKLVTTYLVIH